MSIVTISMPRGDIRPIQFTVIDQAGGKSAIEFDEIYFTVKRSYHDKNFLFQKRLGNGTIETLDDGSYRFVIQAIDTDNLSIGKYVFDIELVLGDEIKQTTVGEFILTPEVTFASNEE